MPADVLFPALPQPRFVHVKVQLVRLPRLPHMRPPGSQSPQSTSLLWLQAAHTVVRCCKLKLQCASSERPEVLVAHHSTVATSLQTASGRLRASLSASSLIAVSTAVCGSLACTRWQDASLDAVTLIDGTSVFEHNMCSCLRQNSLVGLAPNARYTAMHNI